MTATPYLWSNIVHPELSVRDVDEIQDRMHDCFLSWEDTPFLDGWQSRGHGVDCVRFMAAILNFMYRDQRATIDQLPRDLGFHDRGAAVSAMRKMHRIYPESVVVRDRTMEPGDVLVTGPASRAPAHVVMVGARPCHFWQAGPAKVTRCGQPSRIARIYRATDKHLWLT
jgi:hypothetical protein